MQIVWLKKDLRDADHAPLYEASQSGPYLVLYLFEPAIWASPDHSSRHFDYLCSSLVDLRRRLAQKNIPLITKVGDAVAVFDAIHKYQPITRILAHEECGNHVSYLRDIAVRKWCRAHNVDFAEYAQFGFERGPTSRKGWANRWHRKMTAPLIPAPSPKYAMADESLPFVSDPIPEAKRFHLPQLDNSQIQSTGRDNALKDMEDFLYHRGRTYRRDLSSPLTSQTSGSRLSAYLSHGALSMKQLYQHTITAANYAKEQGKRDGFATSLRSFSSRLHWHCHFIQKLEDEPAIEYRNFHPAYDGLRDDNPQSEALQRWQAGMTGFPMIDACMRYVMATGWLNFRMRAMLVSFASYHLMLDWRLPARHLARHFTDYEPGIHYSQFQMQSGTTGINSLRIYNPIKQSQDQDPDGIFIRQWCPELADIPTHMIHTPWLLPARIGTYPLPIVDEVKARRHASTLFHNLRKDITHRAKASQIAEKHGSRKSGLPQNANKPRGAKGRHSGAPNPLMPTQGELPL
ncbi:MAG: FAD-binding domain-containing protein [Candidatus Puniceispirillaceae bacterium]